MQNERDIDILQVEVEERIKKLLEEYTRMWVGDRDGYIQGQEGRRPVPNSGTVRGDEYIAAGGEPGRQ
jgi:hypothetical protein